MGWEVGQAGRPQWSSQGTEERETEAGAMGRGAGRTPSTEWTACDKRASQDSPLIRAQRPTE